MFYVIQNEELKIYDDNQFKLLTTLEFMPQLKDERVLETDIITADELTLHPNKVMIGDVEIEIDVPDYETVIKEIEVPVYKTVQNEELDEEGNVIETYFTQEIDYVETKEVEETIQVGSHKEVITVRGLVLNPNYEEEEKEKRHQQFIKDFFNTSLGWVRRKVSMKTGETKDFLADILPILQVGIPILTYTEEGKQNKVLVTEEFIEECKQQVIKDFYGV